MKPDSIQDTSKYGPASFVPENPWLLMPVLEEDANGEGVFLAAFVNVAVGHVTYLDPGYEL
jgi:hypothetical protein